VYLNTLDIADGGATSFFHYKKKVTPKKGQAVWFKNMNDDGTLNTLSLHSGEEILTDGVIKYALNIWTRQTKF
jgi:prolyl 4-hydroxylase